MSFDWFTYLSETGAEIAPPKLFKHVERSLESVVRPDHTLEVDYSFMQELDDCPTTAVWWPAEVVLVSGFMIRLRLCEPETYFNHSHSRPRPLTSKLASVGEFWFDTKGPNWSVIRYIKLSDDLHSWTVPHFIRPYLIPDYLDETKINWIETEWGRSVQMRSAPRIFFEQRVLYAYELIRIGGYLECEHELDPNCVWPVKVMQNWGGRVHLEWFGADSRRSSSSSWASVQKSAFNANDECGASHDLPNKDLSNLSSLSSTSFTLFYLHRRLHPIGWGKSYALRYCPPTGLYLDRSISNIDAFIRTAPLAICSPAIFENIADTRLLRFGHPSFNEEPFLHEFKVGWKLEAVNPRNPSVIQPATVVKVSLCYF
ncbi:unnamed protein product [Protopolystoma xenopodis]|uniref:Uncharacterized protein n=1 Tax=Protopolystoma xenopodis TaxID=117903 RepID=A0A3S5BGD9_9PLAT|nr:unnamed protein product [Protopolystoma xenopodis]